MCSGRKRRLSELYEVTNHEELNPEDKYVILSDQHKGYRQFDRNKEMYCRVLDYYFERGYKLILLGDVEVFYSKDIQRFLNKYMDDVYPGEARFGTTGPGYYRLWGNHDFEWGKSRNISEYLHQLIPGISEEHVIEALKLKLDDESIIFLTHGHQGEWHGDKLKKLIRFLKHRLRLECVGYPTSASQNHRLRLWSERDYYEWAKENGVMLVTGHTHRPRFESLDKIDRLEMKIERFFHKWSKAQTNEEKCRLERKISRFYKEYEAARRKLKQTKKRKRIGREEFLIPCYFNPGSCIHKKGISCLEIRDGRIFLRFHYKNGEYGTAANPRVLETEKLDYIGVRIRLLT
jgi:predicted phosphodiesterase